MIDGGKILPISEYNSCLTSSRSGPLSCTKSAPSSASSKSVTMRNLSIDAPGASPNSSRLTQAVFKIAINELVSLFSCKYAVTSYPRARKCAVQPPPIGPAPRLEIRFTELGSEYITHL